MITSLLTAWRDKFYRKLLAIFLVIIIVLLAKTYVSNTVSRSLLSNFGWVERTFLIQDKLEEFGRVELGLRSLQYSPEKLQEMARDAFLNGKKLYEEREIAYGNLATAIKSFNEAELYLETVDPKPDFYAEILTARKDCQQELEQRFNNEDFLAERAIKLKAWEEAARALRVILDMIPDRDDPRNVESRKKLLEVENRLKKPR